MEYINERDVIIWDVLVAIISRNILRNCLGWQSFIRQQIRDRIFGNFTYFSGRTYMKDYLPYSCFVTEFG
jgi:hypothetical protein